jgi:hypothetical protein
VKFIGNNIAYLLGGTEENCKDFNQIATLGNEIQKTDPVEC